MFRVDLVKRVLVRGMSSMWVRSRKQKAGKLTGQGFQICFASSLRQRPCLLVGSAGEAPLLQLLGEKRERDREAAVAAAAVARRRAETDHRLHRHQDVRVLFSLCVCVCVCVCVFVASVFSR